MKIRNEPLSLNFHLPEIKTNHRFSKSLKDNNKELLIKKLNDNNTLKYQRNGNIVNHIKSWSRNISKINFKKRKSSSSNEENNINDNKLSSINYIKKKNKPSYNLTISSTFKDKKREQDLNKNNTLLNSNFIKYSSIHNEKNNSLITSNFINRNIYKSISDNYNLYENKNNGNKKYIINNRYLDYYYSDYNTPNKTNHKNFDLSTINIKKINNKFNKLSKDSNINSNYLNSCFDINIKNRNNYKINLTNKKININNDDISQNSIFINNDKNIFKDLEIEKVHHKKNRKYHLSQKTKKLGRNISNISNIKFKLIVPGFMNSSINNFKENIMKNLEDTKISKNNINSINEPLLKDLKYHENKNNVDNFILILKQHIIIENELNNIFGKINNQNDIKDNNNILKSLINEYNIFFNQLYDICFEINIFILKEYNNFLQKIIKVLICLYCLIFIIIALYDIYLCINIIKTHYIDIFKNISFCLYNIFLKFIFIDLKNYKYKDLSFISSIKNLYENNPKYKIKSNLSNDEVFSLLQKHLDIIIDSFLKKLNNNNIFISEILLSLKDILSDINKKDLLNIIDICLNVFLYTLLDKNIQKALLNETCIKRRNSLNSVPYLPPISDVSKYKYTLVLDMDETLGHFISNEIKNKYFSNYGYLIYDDKNNFNKNSENKDKLKVGLFLIRPYAKYFLEELNKMFYEIVIFTAGTKEYCDKIIDILDLNNDLIKYRLYRSHLSLRNINNDVKDLSLLGRDLSKIIIIDNYPDNYKLQQDNGLPINSWTGDINDTSLKDLLYIMKYLVKNNVDDVREIIRKIKMQLNENDINYAKIKLKK